MTTGENSACLSAQGPRRSWFPLEKTTGIPPPVTLAAKSHLRNGRPLLLAVSSNDALAQNARSVGQLLSMKHVYFVPFAQDDALAKPNSLVARFELIPEALASALEGRQVQPILTV